VKPSSLRTLMSSIRRGRSGDTVPFDVPTLRPASEEALTDADLVPEVMTALALLDLLERTRMPMRLGDIACALNISAPAAHDLCQQMLSKAYLRQASDGELSLGPSVVRLALSVSVTSALQGIDSSTLGLIDH
jgi:IclR helix-turn-helix domain